MLSKEKIEEALSISTSLRGTGRILGIAHTEVKRMMQIYKIDLPDHFKFGKKYKDSVGTKINSLTITGVFKKGCKFLCKCDCECGEKNLEKRLDGVLSGRVPSCGCISRNRPQVTGSNNGCFKGIGEFRSSQLLKIKRAALRRDIEFKVTKEYLWNLYLKQNGKCALSGIPIGFGRVHFPHETTASLDRIDSKKVYEEGNLQWVHKDINKLKRNFSEDYFIDLCKAVARHKTGGS